MPQPLKVLIAEDNPADAELLLRELRRAGFEPDWQRVDTEAAYLERLQGAIDLVLSDYAMPQFSGLRALELLKQSGLEVPFILVSGIIGEDTAVVAMKLGATDYLMKDRLGRLGEAVSHALEEFRLRRERRQADEALRTAHLQLGQMLEHSPAILYILKLDGDKIVPHLVSENVNALLGFTVAEASSYEWWAGQLHPDDRERAINSVAETLSAGTSLTEYRLRHKDGHYCWVDDARRSILDAAGKPVELIGVWTDITERKRAEEVLLDASSHVARDRKIQVRIELAILMAVTVSVFLLAARFEWFENATRWIMSYDAIQLDEVVLTAMFFTVGLVVFAFRRWRETESQLTSRQQAQVALGLLHDELDRRVRQRTEELNSANQALRRSEQDFRLLFDRNPMPMWVYDLETLRFLAINDAAVNRYGYARSEFLAMTIKDIRPVEELPALEADLARPVSREPQTRLWRHRKKDGAVIHVMITSHDIPFGDRKGRLVMANDETARKQAEDDLRESEERFRQMTANIDEVFWMTDPAKGSMLYVSPAYEKIWGRTCQNLYEAPTDWMEAIYPEDRKRIQAAMKKQVRGDYNESYRIVRPDGSLRWIHDRAFPVRNAAGEVIRVAGVAQDITEKKQLETQFFRAQRLESIGTLASGIAHDLNNILAPIMMAAPIIRMSKTPEAVEKMLVMVESSTRRAAKLVRQLLTFGRGVDGEKKSLTIAPIISEMLTIARQTFPKNITIAAEFAGDLPPILADATQVHQVLLNLCVNARDAMPEGGALIIAAENVSFDANSASMAPGAKAGDYVLVKVTDTGTGMTPEIIDKIFNPFFTTKEVGKGTGLGLATVLGLVKSHGGFVTLSSEPGKGSTFRVHFPVSTKSVTSPLFAPSVTPPPGQGELLLVVDDEENIRDTVRGTLIEHGYTVVVAEDGVEGTSRFAMAMNEIKLVITDLDMPNMDGLTMIRVLRQMNPKLKIIVSSGVLQRKQMTATRASELTALGVSATLDKPYTADQILRAIHAALAS